MTTTNVRAANAFTRKSIAVLLAVLLCMPMTGFEYMAHADDASSAVQTSDAVQDAQPNDGESASQDSLSGGGLSMGLRGILTTMHR